tara:strand:+ start:244 stop:402 length:159 start_codon:yes stop_codon:yes gene_type:complete
MRKEMFEKYNLVKLQNHPTNSWKDYLSFCAFFSNEEEFKDLADRLTNNIKGA